VSSVTRPLPSLLTGLHKPRCSSSRRRIVVAITQHGVGKAKIPADGAGLVVIYLTLNVRFFFRVIGGGTCKIRLAQLHAPFPIIELENHNLWPNTGMYRSVDLLDKN